MILKVDANTPKDIADSYYNENKAEFFESGYSKIILGFSRKQYAEYEELSKKLKAKEGRGKSHGVKASIEQEMAATRA